MEVYYSRSSSFEEADVRSVDDHVVRFLPIGYVILEIVLPCKVRLIDFHDRRIVVHRDVGLSCWLNHLRLGPWLISLLRRIEIDHRR
jgi:hypothetical protein